MGIGLLAVALLAQLEPFCPEPEHDQCVDDLLSVRFQDTGTSELPSVRLDETITAEVLLDVKSERLQGFSYGLAHDPTYLEIQSATDEGADPAIEAADLRVIRIVQGGESGFRQAVVVTTDLQPPLELPLRDSIKLATAQYVVKALPPPQGTRLSFSSGVGPPPPPGLGLSLVVNGVERRPKHVANGTVKRGMAEPFCDIDLCSEEVFSVRFPATGTSELPSVRLDETITAEVFLDVKSQGLAGLSYGVQHDPAYLEILSATYKGADPIVEQTSPFIEDTLPVRIAEGGLGFIQLVLVNNDENPPYDLPVRDGIKLAIARYRVKALPPHPGTRLEFSSLLRPRFSPPTRVGMAIGGKTWQPKWVFNARVGGHVGGQAPFLRGDVDQNGRLDITDAVGVIRYLFDGINLPDTFDATRAGCLVAFNVDGDRGAEAREEPARIGLADALYLLGYLFGGGPPPAQPFGACGMPADDVAEAMRCRVFACR